MTDSKCTVDGCIKTTHARGLCDKHYRKWLLYKDPCSHNRDYHGMSLHPEYEVWRGMKQRCYNKNKHPYPRYGGRNISVCDRWKNSFSLFYKDMGSIPFVGAEIDRIDNDGNYEPSNCRWVTCAENIQNSSKAKINFNEANEIRILSCMKMPQKKIGLEYGILYNQVSLISRLKTWKYKDNSGRYIV